MKTDNKSEILATRKGGLGGSDAKMVLKVGRKGIESLSETDKKRLAVMTGQLDYNPIATTAAMNRGNEFEAYLAEMVYPEIPNNLRLDLKDNPFTFDVFAHADFCSKASDKVVEAKCTNKNIHLTAEDYEAQLQWYYMLGVKHVWLVHVLQEKDFWMYDQIIIVRNQNVVDSLLRGLHRIDQFIKNWRYEPKAEWLESDLLPWNQIEALEVYKSFLKIKNLENEIERQKENLKNLMRDENIKSIKSYYYTISYVGESVTKTLDKKKLFSDYPDILADNYQKTSKKADYIKIKLKSEE